MCQAKLAITVTGDGRFELRRGSATAAFAPFQCDPSDPEKWWKGVTDALEAVTSGDGPAGLRALPSAIWDAAQKDCRPNDSEQVKPFRKLALCMACATHPDKGKGINGIGGDKRAHARFRRLQYWMEFHSAPVGEARTEQTLKDLRSAQTVWGRILRDPEGKWSSIFLPSAGDSDPQQRIGSPEQEMRAFLRPSRVLGESEKMGDSLLDVLTTYQATVVGRAVADWWMSRHGYRDAAGLHLWLWWRGIFPDRREAEAIGSHRGLCGVWKRLRSASLGSGCRGSLWGLVLLAVVGLLWGLVPPARWTAGYLLPGLSEALALLLLLLSLSTTLINLALPRVTSALVVGYLPVMIVPNAWQIADGLDRPTITIVALLCVLGSFLYLRWEGATKAPGSQEIGIRAASLTAISLALSVAIGVLASLLFGEEMVASIQSGDNAFCPLSEVVDWGAFKGQLYYKQVALFAPAALLLGVLVQILWQERAVTDPLD